ncbi:MAG TPA: heparinase II/III family protein, partial [Longimicrobiaceae bacterium]|nr:heparinase II/III family protein [Longimicrobiaceae bacterium]
MTGLFHYLGRARELPPREVARKAVELVAFRTRRRWRKWTYRLMPDPSSDRFFARRIGMDSEAAGATLFVGDHTVLPVRWATVSADPAAIAALRAIGAMALEHRFDLLGSGPIRVDYSLEPAGVEGHRYRMPPGEEAERSRRAAMEALLPGSAEGYDPIDWQVDFKSGYRWSERSWSADLRYGHLDGVDVKVPWELSRFQHLGALGLLHRLDREGPGGERGAAEFVSQVTDWISANPVRRGVNWVCTMDVAIRAVNWLLALELFRDSAEVMPRFRWLLAKSLYTHGLHIEGHLEYSRQAGSNHYLANVVGLICIAAALPEVPESDRWLAWSIQELASEMDRQVLPDGVDHEGSSGYHFLVAEMFYLGTLIALRAGRHRRDRLRAVPPHRVAHPRAPAYRADGVLPLDRPELFPDSYFDRLLGMAEFGAALAGAGGRVPLYGDHDSGRLYKLTPSGRPGPDGAYREDFRDRRYLAAVAGVLFDRSDLRRVGGAFAADATLLLGDLDAGPVSEAVRTARANGGGVPARVVRRQTADGGGVSFHPDGGIAVIRWGSLHVVITLGTV